MITSSSSVAILLILILSILYRGLPAFTAPAKLLADDIEQIESQIAETESRLASVPEEEKSDLEDQRDSLNSELAKAKKRSDRADGSFVSRPPSPDPFEAGIGPSLMGSIWVCAGCAVFFLPLGLATAVFLEEFRPANRFLRWTTDVMQLNITNLAGVPSIVYGILGLTAFASMFGLLGSTSEPVLEIGSSFKRQYVTEGMQVVFIPVQERDEIPELVTGMEANTAAGDSVILNIIGPDDDFPEDDATLNRSLLDDAEGGVVVDNAWYSFRLPFGRSVLAASLTLMLVILPIIIIASQEALRAVPASLREGALGLGATRWQVVRNVTLPAAIPGIMTGSILSMSRAIGEAAPILMIAGIVRITVGPQHLMDDFSILPLQIFYWAGLPIEEGSAFNFQNVAAGGIIVLLIVLFAFNSMAILIRQMAQKQLT